MKHFFTALLISWGTLLAAQPDTTSRYVTAPVFVQAGLGLFPHSEAFNTEISVAAGYRFNQYLGAGLELRSTFASNVSIGKGSSVAGLHLRGQLDSGWMASWGGGLVFSASQGDDGFFLYDYRAGGYYMAVDVGYQFRRGLTIGAYMTMAHGQTFDVSEYNLDTDQYEPTERSFTTGLISLGFKVGYAFPSRGR